MIQIAESGNSTIKVVTGGTELGTQWTVYPYLQDDPPLQKLPPEQQKRIQELGITGSRGKDDLSGHKMNLEIANAIARLRDNLGDNPDLGITIVGIDVNPQSEIAQLLATDHGIKPLQKPSSDPEPYDPEPGSALAEMVNIARLEQQEPDPSTLKKLDPYGPDFSQWLDKERDKDEHRDHIHSQREVSRPEYKQMDSVDISNLAFRYYMAQQEAGDKKGQFELTSEFIASVYPAFQAFKTQRLSEQSTWADDDPYKAGKLDHLHYLIMEDFLDGKDLETPKTE